MKQIFYRKLIRDGIVAKMNANGAKYEIRTLKDDEYHDELFRKLQEEAVEVTDDLAREDILKELSDLNMVMDAIREHIGISDEEYETFREVDRKKKGGYADRTYLEWSGDDNYTPNADGYATEQGFVEPTLPTGRYEHYKGGYYEVIGTARHSESHNVLVLYKHEGEERIWARPLKMFEGTVNRNGETKKRFTHIPTPQED